MPAVSVLSSDLLINTYDLFSNIYTIYMFHYIMHRIYSMYKVNKLKAKMYTHHRFIRTGRLIFRPDLVVIATGLQWFCDRLSSNTSLSISERFSKA